MQINHSIEGNGEDSGSKIGFMTIWALGVGSAMGGVFYGWEFVLYGGFIFGVLGVFYVASFFWLYAQMITELTMRYRSTGGSFDFVAEALGIRSSVVVAIMSMLKLIFANTATALAITSYLAQGGFPIYLKYIIWIIIYGLFTALDCLGIRQSANVQVVATLFCVCIIIFYFITTATQFHVSNLLTVPHISNRFDSVYLFFVGLPFATQFFDGFEEIPLLLSYAENPEVTLPKAIFYCYLTISIIAFSVLTVAAAASSTTSLLTSDAPLMLAINQVFASTSFAFLIDIMAFAIVLGLLVNFFSFTVYASQQMQAIAEARLLPRYLTYREMKYGAPIAASLTSGGIGLFLIFTSSLILGDDGAQNTLMMAAIIPTNIVYLFVLQCIIKIRKIEREYALTQGKISPKDLSRLGYDPGAFHVYYGEYLARFAQIMVVFLLLGIFTLAARDFDYAYGIMVFISISLFGYMSMVHKARRDIREEDALNYANEKQNMLVSSTSSRDLSSMSQLLPAVATRVMASMVASAFSRTAAASATASSSSAAQATASSSSSRSSSSRSSQQQAQQQQQQQHSQHSNRSYYHSPSGSRISLLLASGLDEDEDDEEDGVSNSSHIHSNSYSNKIYEDQEQQAPLLEDDSSNYQFIPSSRRNPTASTFTYQTLR